MATMLTLRDMWRAVVHFHENKRLAAWLESRAFAMLREQKRRGKGAQSKTAPPTLGRFSRIAVYGPSTASFISGISKAR
jgi:hypothetical protein